MEEVCPVVKKSLKRHKCKQIMSKKYVYQDEIINNKCIFDSWATGNTQKKTGQKIEILYN